MRPLKSVMQRIARISLFSILALLFVGLCYSIHPALGVFACFVVAFVWEY